jgi:proliferating cell nuclear antigen
VDGETVVLNRSSDYTNGIKVQNNANNNEIVQGIFELKYLGFFTKCTSLCPTVEIFLKNDYPLILRYYVGNLGEVRFVLAALKKK